MSPARNDDETVWSKTFASASGGQVDGRIPIELSMPKICRLTSGPRFARVRQDRHLVQMAIGRASTADGAPTLAVMKGVDRMTADVDFSLGRGLVAVDVRSSVA